MAPHDLDHGFIYSLASEDRRPFQAVSDGLSAVPPDVVQEGPRSHSRGIHRFASFQESIREHLGHLRYNHAVPDHGFVAAIFPMKGERLFLGGDHLASSSSSWFIFHLRADFRSALSSLFSGFEQVGHLKKFSMASSNVLVWQVAVPQW